MRQPFIELNNYAKRRVLAHREITFYSNVMLLVHLFFPLAVLQKNVKFFAYKLRDVILHCLVERLFH